MAGHGRMRWVVRIFVAGLIPSGFAACGSSNGGGAGSNTVDNGGPSGPSTPSPALAPNPSVGGTVREGEGAGGPAMSPSGNDGSVPSAGTGNEGVMPTELDEGAGMQPEQGGSEMTGEEVTPTPTVSCPAGATLQAGDTTLTIDVDGVERSFLVHAPPSYDGTTRMPVMLDFHGLTGNSNGQRNLTGFDDVADAEGFIAIYPQGLPNENGQNAWNAGNCCGSTSDDVGFVRAIISTLQTEACIDARRVYASGCSNGGGMSYRLACEAADVIAAVAPVDFDCVVGGACDNCSPSRPITTVQFRGTNDQLVPYDGNGGGFVGAQQNFAIWGEFNACTGDPAALQQSADGCESLPMCSAGAETVLCTVQNGTHCGSYDSFDIAQVAWDILQNHALP
jgi:polyhydroxybutyrate depolymerase